MKKLILLLSSLTALNMSYAADQLVCANFSLVEMDKSIMLLVNLETNSTSVYDLAADEDKAMAVSDLSLTVGADKVIGKLWGKMGRSRIIGYGSPVEHFTKYDLEEAKTAAINLNAFYDTDYVPTDVLSKVHLEISKGSLSNKTIKTYIAYCFLSDTES